MSRTLTIRNVPDEVADELAQRASSSGRSLQSLLLAVLRREAATPPVEDVLREIRAEARQTGIRVDSAELLRILDEERDR